MALVRQPQYDVRGNSEEGTRSSQGWVDTDTGEIFRGYRSGDAENGYEYVTAPTGQMVDNPNITDSSGRSIYGSQGLVPQGYEASEEGGVNSVGSSSGFTDAGYQIGDVQADPRLAAYLQSQGVTPQYDPQYGYVIPEAANPGQVMTDYVRSIGAGDTPKGGVTGFLDDYAVPLMMAATGYGMAGGFGGAAAAEGAGTAAASSAGGTGAAGSGAIDYSLAAGVPSSSGIGGVGTAGTGYVMGPAAGLGGSAVEAGYGGITGVGGFAGTGMGATTATGAGLTGELAGTVASPYASSLAPMGIPLEAGAGAADAAAAGAAGTGALSGTLTAAEAAELAGLNASTTGLGTAAADTTAAALAGAPAYAVPEYMLGGTAAVGGAAGATGTGATGAAVTDAAVGAGGATTGTSGMGAATAAGAAGTAAAGTAAGGGVFDTFMDSLSTGSNILKTGAALASIGSGIDSIINSGISPTEAQNISDPFASSREKYITQLNALMANPSLTMSQPGYQFQYQQGLQALNRNLAKRGMGTDTPGQFGVPAAGAAGIAQQQYGQKYALGSYSDYVNQLAGLAGATQKPSVGGEAALNAQKYAQAEAQRGFSAVGTGAGTLSTLFNNSQTRRSPPYTTPADIEDTMYWNNLVYGSN